MGSEVPDGALALSRQLKDPRTAALIGQLSEKQDSQDKSVRYGAGTRTIKDTQFWVGQTWTEEAEMLTLLLFCLQTLMSCYHKQCQLSYLACEIWTTEIKIVLKAGRFHGATACAVSGWLPFSCCLKVKAEIAIHQKHVKEACVLLWLWRSCFIAELAPKYPYSDWPSSQGPEPELLLFFMTVFFVQDIQGGHRDSLIFLGTGPPPSPMSGPQIYTTHQLHATNVCAETRLSN